MCQALGFAIPCMLYKLGSFILYCTHVEFPPLDFHIQIYVKIMQMTLPRSNQSLGCLCLTSPLPCMPSSVLTSSAGEAQGSLNHPSLPSECSLMVGPLGSVSSAHDSRYVFLFALGFAEAPRVREQGP